MIPLEDAYVSRPPLGTNRTEDSRCSRKLPGGWQKATPTEANNGHESFLPPRAIVVDQYRLSHATDTGGKAAFKTQRLGEDEKGISTHDNPTEIDLHASPIILCDNSVILCDNNVM